MDKNKQEIADIIKEIMSSYEGILYLKTIPFVGKSLSDSAKDVLCDCFADKIVERKLKK